MAKKKSTVEEPVPTNTEESVVDTVTDAAEALKDAPLVEIPPTLYTCEVCGKQVEHIEGTLGGSPARAAFNEFPAQEEVPGKDACTKCWQKAIDKTLKEEREKQNG